MTTTLLILRTREPTREDAAVLDALKKQAVLEVREIDLNQPGIDYIKVTRAILASNRVQVW